MTLWYAAVVCITLLLLGGSILVVLRHQVDSDLDRSLRAAVQDVERDGQPALNEHGAGTVEPGRRDGGATTYLFNTAGRALAPPAPDAWIDSAATRAARDRHAGAELDVPGDTTLRLYAERFTGANGSVHVAVAVAPAVEIEDRYRGLIAAFGGAAALAVLLMALGGWLLARVSSAPVEASFDQMRRFVADAAHELRTPLAVLRSRTEVALQRPRDAQVYERTLQDIASDSRHLGEVVDDLFMLTRADAGERPVITARVSLDDIVMDVAEAAQLIAGQKGVKVDIHEFEEALVEGDATLVRRLVTNVLDNAVKFTPRGGSVSVRVNAAHDRPTVVVEDSGIGIAPADLARIFDRFYRVDPARTLHHEHDGERSGAGLGLSIARWIADVHGATIDVVSQPGAGTRVTIRFPAATPREHR